jgi:hypothetical protein
MFVGDDADDKTKALFRYELFYKFFYYTQKELRNYRQSTLIVRINTEYFLK